MANDVDIVMETIPKEWRTRWCGGEDGPCACMGCVQIGNRLIMAKAVAGVSYRGDPEHIDESCIPAEIYDQFKVTKPEWEAWMTARQVAGDHLHKDNKCAEAPVGYMGPASCPAAIATITANGDRRIVIMPEDQYLAEHETIRTTARDDAYFGALRMMTDSEVTDAAIGDAAAIATANAENTPGNNND